MEEEEEQQQQQQQHQQQGECYPEFPHFFVKIPPKVLKPQEVLKIFEYTLRSQRLFGHVFGSETRLKSLIRYLLLNDGKHYSDEIPFDRQSGVANWRTTTVLFQ